MDKKTFEDILKLNRDFYESVAESFDNTRQKPWRGWSRVMDYINRNFQNVENISKDNKTLILDLACGNGRFFSTLSDNALFSFDYIGYDISHKLLSLAKNKYKDKNPKFEHKDIISDTGTIPNADLIVAFGITHHIPSSEYRLKWFENIASKVNPQGMFIYSNWNFTKQGKNSDLSTKLEVNDKLHGWQFTQALRYIHTYDTEEHKKINEVLEKNLILKEKFNDDGKDNLQNTYFIYIAK